MTVSISRKWRARFCGAESRSESAAAGGGDGGARAARGERRAFQLHNVKLFP
jgi:hypothetical protein